MNFFTLGVIKDNPNDRKGAPNKDGRTDKRSPYI
jgi:hypothetical protein